MEPCHNLLLSNGIMGFENVGGDLYMIVGKRVTFSGFPIRFYMGDGSIVRLVAFIDEDDLSPGVEPRLKQEGNLPGSLLAFFFASACAILPVIHVIMR